jgi:hypothetical protein
VNEGQKRRGHQVGKEGHGPCGAKPGIYLERTGRPLDDLHKRKSASDLTACQGQGHSAEKDHEGAMAETGRYVRGACGMGQVQ